MFRSLSHNLKLHSTGIWPRESVEFGYSDIFLEYSIMIHMTARSTCLEYSDIYLEYVNPFPSDSKFWVSRVCNVQRQT